MAIAAYLNTTKPLLNHENYRDTPRQQLITNNRQRSYWTVIDWLYKISMLVEFIIQAIHEPWEGILFKSVLISISVLFHDLYPLWLLGDIIDIIKSNKCGKSKNIYFCSIWRWTAFSWFPWHTVFTIMLVSKLACNNFSLRSRCFMK